MRIIKKSIQAIFNGFGLEIRKKASTEVKMPVELTKEEVEIVNYIKKNNLSMASYERLWATLMACKYSIDQNIEGDFVECGVWRGGNALIAAALFRLYGVNKKVYCFDTFGGMTPPTEKDRHASNNKSALEDFLKNQTDTHNEWCYASLEDVKNNFKQFGLLNENVVFVKGDVCKTLDIEENIPKTISVLRLDTDWYESTKKELEVLYPRISIGGPLLIDDYGHWAGSKEATDEYFKKYNNRPFFQYTDYTGRVAIKIR